MSQPADWDDALLDDEVEETEVEPEPEEAAAAETLTPEQMQQQLADLTARAGELERGRQELLDHSANDWRKLQAAAREIGQVYDRDSGRFGVTERDKAIGFVSSAPAAQAPVAEEPELPEYPSGEEVRSYVAAREQGLAQSFQKIIQDAIAPLVQVTLQQAQPVVQNYAKQALEARGWGHLADNPQFQQELQQQLDTVPDLATRNNPAFVARAAGFAAFALDPALLAPPAPGTVTPPAPPASNGNSTARNGMRATAPSRGTSGSNVAGPTETERRAAATLGRLLPKRLDIRPEDMAGLVNEDDGRSYRARIRAQMQKGA